MEKQHEPDIINKAPGLTKVSLAQCACPPNTCHYSVSVDHLGPVSESGLSPPVTGICTYCHLLHGGRRKEGEMKMKERGRKGEERGRKFFIKVLILRQTLWFRFVTLVTGEAGRWQVQGFLGYRVSPTTS